MGIFVFKCFLAVCFVPPWALSIRRDGIELALVLPHDGMDCPLVHSLRRLQALNPVIGLAAVSDLVVGYFMIGIRASRAETIFVSVEK
jgi:hypothetical protein